MPTEKDLDRALEKALREGPNFRAWFVNKTRFKVKNPEPVLLRSDNPWCRANIELPNPQTGELKIVARDGETDVLFVFKAEDGRILALHIENKLASGRFTPFQLQMYKARAEKWVGNQIYGTYDEWDTVLIAPMSFLKSHAAIAQEFGTILSHEEIAVHVPAFGREK